MADFTAAEIETGTGQATALVYASLSDATVRLLIYGRAADRVAWAASSEAPQKAAMQRATRFMINAYRLRWKGVRVLNTQALDFPRNGLDDGEFHVAATVVPIDVVNASIDLAPRALAGDLQVDLDDAGLIEREKVRVGSVEEDVTYVDGKSGQKEYAAIDEMLAPYFLATDVAQRA